jgi:predicted small secreted protein
MKRILSIVLLAITVLGATGCSTLKGLGEDIKNAGDAITGGGKK